MKEEQKINGFPKDWKKIKLGELCEIVSGNTPKGLEQVSNKGKYQFYKVSDMNLQGNETSMISSNLHLTEEEIKSLRIKVYPKGTVIFPKRGGAILTNKKRILSRPSSFDLNVMGILPNENVESSYLYYWFQKLDLTKIYDGSNVPQINNKNIAPLEFPLPTINKQRKIVSKIEELFSELDKGIEELKTAQQQLKVYRQAVLKWAFEGKLTNENVKDNVLPERWKWEKLGNACDKIQDGSHFSPQQQYVEAGEDRFMYITAKNIRNDYMDLSKLTYVDKEFHDSIYQRCNPEYGDVLLTKDGVNTGEVTLNPLHEPFSLLSSVCIFKTNKDQLAGAFLKYFIQSPFGAKAIINSMTGTAIKRIILRKIKESAIVLPPIEEQQQIVQEIESRLSVCDKIEETITNSLKQAEALRQSILKKAFQGKLI
jgi:type I restriction enzyme, S subunit